MKSLTLIIGDMSELTKSFHQSRSMASYSHISTDVIFDFFNFDIHNKTTSMQDNFSTLAELAHRIHEIKNIIISITSEISFDKLIDHNISTFLSLLPEEVKIFILESELITEEIAHNILDRRLFFVKKNNQREIIAFNNENNLFTELNLTILGSCDSRDTISVNNELCQKKIQLQNFFSRTSFSAIYSEPMSYDKKLIDLSSPFLKKCVTNDLDKNITSLLKSSLSTSDGLLIDLMDERFDVIVNDKTIITNSWDYRATKLSKTLNHKATDAIAFNSEERFELWTDGFDKLMSEAIKIIPAEKVYIIRTPMATMLYNNFDTSEFDDRKYNISIFNVVLKKMYDYISTNYPKVSCIEPLQWMVFCDHRHRWGAHPYHYNNYIYLHFAAKIKAISASNNIKYPN